MADNMKSFWAEYGFIILVIAAISILVGGVGFNVYNFQQDMVKAGEEIRIKLADERKLWDGLDCDGKHDYLQGKDLSGNRIFYVNQNEDLYREWVLNCLPPEIAKEIKP